MLTKQAFLAEVAVTGFVDEYKKLAQAAPPASQPGGFAARSGDLPAFSAKANLPAKPKGPKPLDITKGIFSHTRGQKLVK